MKQENQLNQSFWNNRWENQQTGWDIDMASPAITNYMLQYPNKNAAILIPGCGNAHEAEWLLQNGFTNITLIDIAPKAAELLQKRYAKYPKVKVILGDFFDHQEQYDLIIEQTFFCAIDPNLPAQYVTHTSASLKPSGKIIGVLFNTDFEKAGPPFGGNITEYGALFRAAFIIKKMGNCYNSINPRINREVFIHLIKK